ncbi:hypothetical protein JTB14_027042 [Gonioctena quinquepunctata]|nr:hypothetical protein JTB14_027042 [Gonioctena quinquepunctata]
MLRSVKRILEQVSQLPTTSRSLNSSDNEPPETTALEDGENNIAISEDLNKMPSTSTSSTSAGQVVCCIFCNQKQKKSGKQVLNLIISSSNELCERIKNVAESLDDRPHFSEKNSTQATTQVISICSDIIYAVTKGACKPAKNVTLGLALKSITNSRQVITMLDKYGHTISYNLAEELETEVIYTSVQDSKVLP